MNATCDTLTASSMARFVNYSTALIGMPFRYFLVVWRAQLRVLSTDHSNALLSFLGRI